MILVLVCRDNGWRAVRTNHRRQAIIPRYVSVVVQDVAASVFVRRGSTSATGGEPLGALCIVGGSRGHTIQCEDRIRLILPDDKGTVGVANVGTTRCLSGQRIDCRQLPGTVTRASKDLQI